MRVFVYKAVHMRQCSSNDDDSVCMCDNKVKGSVQETSHSYSKGGQKSREIKALHLSLLCTPSAAFLDITLSYADPLSFNRS